MSLALTCACTPADADAIVISLEAPSAWSSEDTIHIRGARWFWTAVRNKVELVAEAGLPIGKPVKLVVESTDRQHRLYFPALGLDVEAAPDRPAEVWVTMQRSGEWTSLCVQECLPGQPEALTLKFIAVSPQDAEQMWIDLHRHEPEKSLAAFGARIFDQKGCASCHSLDAPGRGPPLRRFWGSTTVAADGRTVQVEGEVGEALIRDSLFQPNAFLLQGYPPSMPAYTGQLTEEQTRAIIEHLRCLAEPQRAGCTAAGPEPIDPRYRRADGRK